MLVNVGGIEQAVDGDDPTTLGRFLTRLFLSFLLTTMGSTFDSNFWSSLRDNRRAFILVKGRSALSFNVQSSMLT